MTTQTQKTPSARPARSLPDLEDVRAFCEVIDHGSLTRAAEALGQSKGTISRRLTRLERDVGSALLKRTARLVAPTEAGQRFRREMGRVLALYADAAAHPAERGETPAGRLRVTAPQDLALTLLGPIVPRFLERYPDIQLEVLSSERRVDLEAEGMDVALRATWTSLKDSSLKCIKLLELQFGLFASPDYLSATSPPQTPSELSEHPLLSFGPTSNVALHVHEAGEGSNGSGAADFVELTATLWSNDGAFILQSALAGAGIALLPFRVAEQHLNNGTLQQVLPQHRVGLVGYVYLVYAPTRLLEPKVRAFRDFLSEMLT